MSWSGLTVPRKAGKVLVSWRKDGVQEKFCSWSPLFYSQFIHKLGCLLMISAGQEPCLNFSPFLNAPQPLAGGGSCGCGRAPPLSFFICPCLGSLSLFPSSWMITLLLFPDMTH